MFTCSMLLRPMPLAITPRPDAIGAAPGFSCEACGSPAVILPSDLNANGLVICDHCHHPVATFGEFRDRVSRLLVGLRHCDPDSRLG